MIKKTNNSGWILCPSKTYPGKFYYFNVLNGEAAWSLNDNEKKVLKKEVTIQKLKYNHLYPEPLTPPDHPSPETSKHSSIRKPLPTFGQATFPKYISNDKKNMAIIWKPIQMPQLVTNTKKTLDQNTQTEVHNINIHTCTIPLSKRFENKTNEHFGSINYVSANATKHWWNSTNVSSNIGKQSVTPEFQYKIDTKPLLKESKLKRLQCSNMKDPWDTSAYQYSNQLSSNKVENPEAMANQSFINLDINDLRFVLRAKRRKSVEMRDLDNKFNREHSTLDTKKVTFGDNNMFYSEKKYTGKSTKYTNGNQQAWYLVVDLDVLLEDYDCINHYIEEDENCHLYIPSVIQNQLKILSMGEHGDRSRVIVARQLLRQLGSNMPRLNISENKTQQIIKCCLEIKRNNDVVLITKDIGLIHTAKLHKIQSHHIDDIKYNELKNIPKFQYKQNLFLQNKSDFDPFIISKSVHDENYVTQNITDINKDFELNNTKSLINDVSHINEINCDISDINLNINRLDINDKIFNIERKVKNNLFDYQISQTNEIYKKKYHNISIHKTFGNKNDNFDEVFENKKETHNILEDMLKKFYIKNNIMEHNLYVRFDEWICTYEQIIEDFLYIILQNYLQQVHQPPPWFLHEGMECLQEIYRDNKDIVNIIKKLLHSYDFSSEYGANTKPYNFMKLFGCGVYLVESLENTSPLYISDIKNKLNYLKDMLERPIEDLPVDSPIRNNTEDGHEYRYNFVKNPSYVLDYLKKHFSEWKDCNEDYNNNDEKYFQQDINKDNRKVLRTCGRHLNKLTINKSKCISFTKETDKQTQKHDFQSNNFPKVIRNVKLLDSYEEKIKRNNCEYMNKAIIIDNVNSDIISKNNNSQNNDFPINDNNEINDYAKDSGFGSNSLHAYSLVRNFLSELSLSFKIIHTFIDESIKNYSEDISEESKKDLYEKASKTHTHVAEIIDKLKIIIQRESIESSTLKSLLIKSGSEDKRTIRYRPVVMKCLEQATVLENSLRLMLAVTKEEVASVSSNENIHFINIYE